MASRAPSLRSPPPGRRPRAGHRRRRSRSLRVRTPNRHSAGVQVSPAREDAPMVQAIYFIKRKAGMNLEDFRRCWLTTHAELVRRVAGLRRYVQSHTLDSGYRKHEPLYDGVAE